MLSGRLLPRNIAAGDVLLGLPSSGVHSNGFSLVRKIREKSGLGWDAPAPFAPAVSLGRALLAPTRIYVKLILATLKKTAGLKGLAHITGGGVLNIARMNAGFDYHLSDMPQAGARPEVFDAVLKNSGIETSELYRSFNMGIGFVIATAAPEKARAALTAAGETPRIIGKVENGSGKVLLNGAVI